MIKTVGSICSGIEAASVAWEPFGVNFDWFSEIAPFPSRVLAEKYPLIPNLDDMNNIPEKITHGKITAPDLICGGTPCQAFSLAGWQNGLKMMQSGFLPAETDARCSGKMLKVF